MGEKLWGVVEVDMWADRTRKQYSFCCGMETKTHLLSIQLIIYTPTYFMRIYADEVISLIWVEGQVIEEDNGLR